MKIWKCNNTYKEQLSTTCITYWLHSGADKSLAWPGKKQVNVSVRMGWISFGALPCKKKKLDDSSRLDVIEITSVTDMLPSLFPTWSG